jgi:hydroxymethylglutaryl-CoA reductase
VRRCATVVMQTSSVSQASIYAAWVHIRGDESGIAKLQAHTCFTFAAVSASAALAPAAVVSKALLTQGAEAMPYDYSKLQNDMCVLCHVVSQAQHEWTSRT